MKWRVETVLWTPCDVNSGTSTVPKKMANKEYPVLDFYLMLSILLVLVLLLRTPQQNPNNALLHPGDHGAAVAANQVPDAGPHQVHGAGALLYPEDHGAAVAANQVPDAGPHQGAHQVQVVNEEHRGRPTLLTPDQVEIFNILFETNEYLTKDQVSFLMEAFNLERRFILRWFGYQRAKKRNQNQGE